MKEINIYKPDWFEVMGSTSMLQRMYDRLDKWFDDNVEPINEMLSEGIEVYGGFNNGFFTDKETNTNPLDNYRALIINRHPIKKETAEDVLRDIFRTLQHCLSSEDVRWESFEERAKAVLGSKS